MKVEMRTVEGRNSGQAGRGRNVPPTKAFWHDVRLGADKLRVTNAEDGGASNYKKTTKRTQVGFYNWL